MASPTRAEVVLFLVVTAVIPVATIELIEDMINFLGKGVESSNYFFIFLIYYSYFYRAFLYYLLKYLVSSN